MDGLGLVANPLAGGLHLARGDFRDLPSSYPPDDAFGSAADPGDLLSGAMASSGVMFDFGGGSLGAAAGVPPPNSAANHNLVELGKSLLAAARDGDTDEVQQLIAKGAPFTTDWLGTSPLHMAAQYGHHKTCARLLASGISKDAKTKVDKTPLHVAATEGHLQVMEVLLKHGVNVDAVDLLNMTPLHWAVDRAHVEAVELLLTYNASVEVSSKFDKSPLEVASDNDRPDIFEMLQNPEPYRRQRHEDPTVSDPATLAATNSITLPAAAGDVGGSDIQQAIAQELVSPGAVAASSSAAAIHSPRSDAMKLLESHGITLLPEDNPSEAPLENLMRNGGQRLALTEAGKLALGAGGTVVPANPAAAPGPKKVIRKVIRTTTAAPGKVLYAPGTLKRQLVTTAGGQQFTRVISLGQGGVPTATAAAGGTTKVIKLPAGMATAAAAGGGKARILQLTPDQYAKFKAAQDGSKKNLVLTNSGGVRKAIAINPAAVAGSPAKKTVKIIRVDQATGNQTVSQVVLPAGASIASAAAAAAGGAVTPLTAGASPTIAVLPPTVAKAAAVPAAAPAAPSMSEAEKELQRLKAQLAERDKENERLKARLAAATAGKDKPGETTDSGGSNQEKTSQKASATSEEVD